MYLALTYDHRLLDGREAVTFLVKIKVRRLVAKTQRTSLTQSPGIHRGPRKDATGINICGQSIMSRVHVGELLERPSSCGSFNFKRQGWVIQRGCGRKYLARQEA